MRIATRFFTIAFLISFVVGCSSLGSRGEEETAAVKAKPPAVVTSEPAPDTDAPVAAAADADAHTVAAPETNTPVAGALAAELKDATLEQAPISESLAQVAPESELARTTLESLHGRAVRGRASGLGLDVRSLSAVSDPLARFAMMAPESREAYEAMEDNAFRSPTDHPLSTFSIDVGTASYSNVRRFITNGDTPPADAVRVEEMINYFRYDYPEPDGDAPFAVYAEVGDAPWRPEHRLVHIGLQGRRVEQADRPASNLVFLMDVSGSMRARNKLPLLKKAFRLLVGELDERDRVAIVTYAGQAGLALEPTSGANKQAILQVVAGLGAGGSTAGADGIRTAYDLARKSFIPGGINRVILATDGDFNVGISDDGALVRMIEKKREGGVFLTVLGFGEGNLQDAKMHKLADKGNGSYHYIDSIFEAKKVLIDEMGATLQTIAKDVKIQVEFNPAHVAAYRLVGYETRLLAAEDFADDKKDAGELGAGHTVTALYEIIPRGVKSPELDGLDIPLKYQRQDLSDEAEDSGELLTVKLRYKEPEGDVSKLITQVIAADAADGEPSDSFQFSAAVALFGMLLRESESSGDATVDDALEIARESLGPDEAGYRRAFVDMVEIYGKLAATRMN
jgi:Ca-activated chloride channel family protein